MNKCLEFSMDEIDADIKASMKFLFISEVYNRALLNNVHSKTSAELFEVAWKVIYESLANE